MQIVIDISDEEYENIKLMYIHNNATATNLRRIILNGTPLPKGHGDLIDKDKLQYEFDWLEKVTNESSILEKAEHEKLMECIRIVESAPTIIEAGEV